MMNIEYRARQLKFLAEPLFCSDFTPCPNYFLPGVYLSFLAFLCHWILILSKYYPSFFDSLSKIVIRMWLQVASYKDHVRPDIILIFLKKILFYEYQIRRTAFINTLFNSNNFWKKKVSRYVCAKFLTLDFFIPLKDLTPWPFPYKRLLNKPNENEITLREQNLSLKCFKKHKILNFHDGLQGFQLTSAGRSTTLGWQAGTG